MSKEESWIISIGKLHTTIYNQDQKIADLEAKLAEKEEKLEAQTTLRKMMSDESNVNLLRYIETLAKNEELKQQLAEKEKEKEKEIERLKSENHALMSDNAYQEADIFELNSFKEYYKNNKISFAVEQLEKVKGNIQHNILFVNCDDYVNVIEEIDNQIKQLKEMK